MEGRDKRKPAVILPPHVAKRSKINDESGFCVNNSCTTEVSLPTDSSNFEKSCAPVRFMFYERGEWQDFLRETCASLVAAFQARRSSVSFSVHGGRYLLSFIRMLQINLITGFCRSVAWIDVNGQLFSPSRCIEAYGIQSRQFGNKCACAHDSVSSSIISMPGLTDQKSPLDVDVSQQDARFTIAHVSSSASAISGHDRCDKGLSSVSSDTTSTFDSVSSMPEATSNVYDANDHTCDPRGSRDFPLPQDKLVTLKDTEPEFDEVKNKFMAGLSILANHTVVTNIRKDCHRSSSGRVRHQAFKQQEHVTKRLRGDANVRYAWYGTSKNGVSSIVLHGFGQPKTLKDGAMYGAGIYLAPENYSNVSAMYSDVDENGEQHVVLCRVIMGHMEQIHRGSVQFHPSSEDFDGAVDDLHNPRQYIVWTTHMNTHILPVYIVSFKLTTPWQVTIAALRSKQKVCGKLFPFEHRCSGHVKVKGDLGKEAMPRYPDSPPRSPWFSIEMLFLLLKSSLCSVRMATLRQHYLDFKEGRLPSSDFMSSVRVIAGDDLVKRSVKSMQMHAVGAAVLQNLIASRRCQMADSKGQFVV